MINRQARLLRIRRLKPADLEPLSRLWHATWHEAHAAHVSPRLTRRRTLASFRTRLEAMAKRIRVVGRPGEPLGFCAVKGAEIDQLFTSTNGRGTGAAARLLADGEDRIRTAGHQTASLYCIPQNTRALRFYEKSGWQIARRENAPIETSEGTIELDCLLLTKDLAT